jgi:hypothetical protein
MKGNKVSIIVLRFCLFNVRLRILTCEICADDERALIARQKDNRMSLLDSLAETTSREMDLATMTLGLIVTEPVLEQGSVEWCGTQRVESGMQSISHREREGKSVSVYHTGSLLVHAR